MHVTILIPCKDESPAIGHLGDALARLPEILGAGYGVAIVAVDDGSTDATSEALAAMSEALPFSVEIRGHDVNKGIGAALRTAAEGLAGDVVVTYDADRPYPLEDLPRLLQPIVDDQADVVSASPWHPDGAADGVPGSRALVSRLASSLYRLRLGRRARGLFTITSGYRASRRHTFVSALPRRDGFTATAEMLLNALRHGARATEIPSTLRTRTEGRSKMRILRTAWSHLGLLLRG